MCIAICNKKGILNKDVLKTCSINNPDGMGFMYSDGKKINVHKELKNFDKFYKMYVSKRKQYATSIFVLHFRIATSGGVNIHNTHPFKVNDNLYFCHNGIIRIPLITGLSDTQCFNNTYLKNLPDNFLSNKAIVNLICEYIGHSKLIFLHKNGHANILNSNLGEWQDGNWFSNDTYKKQTYQYYIETCEYCNKKLSRREIKNNWGLCDRCLKDEFPLESFEENNFHNDTHPELYNKNGDIRDGYLPF